MNRPPVPQKLKRPVRQDFICWKGQSWNRNLRYIHETTHDTYDLTGWEAKAEIRPEQNSDTIAAEIHVGVIGVDGLISLALTHEQTAELWPGDYAWDLKTIEPNGEVKYWIYGKFTVKGRTTR